MEPPVRVESVESVEGGHAGLAHEGLLLGVDPDVDLDTVWSLSRYIQILPATLRAYEERKALLHSSHRYW